jgi:hypothetical protein
MRRAIFVEVKRQEPYGTAVAARYTVLVKIDKHRLPSPA